MSYGEPVPCKNNCGSWIYFDKDSKVGHPSTDKWLPLEYNHDSGMRTGLIHQCPNRPKQQQSQQALQEQQAQQQQGSTTIVTEPTSMKIINAKLDRIIALLESQQQQQQKK